MLLFVAHSCYVKTIKLKIKTCLSDSMRLLFSSSKSFTCGALQVIFFPFSLTIFYHYYFSRILQPQISSYASQLTAQADTWHLLYSPNTTTHTHTPHQLALHTTTPIPTQLDSGQSLTPSYALQLCSFLWLTAA